MPATITKTSQIKSTNADRVLVTSAGRVSEATAADVRSLISVYSTSEVDGLLSGLAALTSADIDTLAELNAILSDADVASVSYVDATFATIGHGHTLSDISDAGTAAAADSTDFATAAQGLTADSAVQPGDITSGTITAGTANINLTSGSTGDVLTQQADGSFAMSAAAGGGGTPGGSSGQMQYNSAGAFGGTTAIVYAGSGSHLTITAQSASDVPVRVKGAASQSGNYIEVSNSSNNNGLILNPSGILHLGAVIDAFTTPAIWVGNISQAGDISLRGNWASSGRYGLGYDVGNNATFLYSYNGAKLSLGTRTYAGAFQPRLTFNDAAGVQTWTHSEGINYVFGTSTGTKIGTAAAQKLGFWNATPVVQQVLATGASHTVDDIISLLQTLGLCRQS